MTSDHSVPACEPTKRGRGRPRGSKLDILKHKSLGVHHFAFVRSWFQGLDLRWAWDRYLAFAEVSSDLRHVERRRKEILEDIISAAHRYNLQAEPHARVSDLVAIVSKGVGGASATVLPSLDEFIESQGIDRDFYPEAELIEMHQAHYASLDEDDSGAGESDRSSEQVKALNFLATILARKPAERDVVSEWIHPKVSSILGTHGIIRLADLVSFINVYGLHWYRRIKGLGCVRSQRIIDWLDSLDDCKWATVRETSRISTSSVPLPALTRRFDVVPLESLDVPEHLSGTNGKFRTFLPNTFGAHSDLDAIRSWLLKYEERPNTFRSYKKEAERFYLWCLHEAQKPLSSVDSNDCRAYRHFLADIPPHWLAVGNAAVTGEWRPFRKKLSPSSQKLSLVVIQAMFEAFMKSGYSVANPMAAVINSFNLPEPKINTDRSFTEREWSEIMTRAYAIPDAAERTRTTLVLEMLCGMGLRREEMATATRKNLSKIIDPEFGQAHLLKVTGKRRKVREVPVPEHVVLLIDEHAQHHAPRNADEDPPLIFASSQVPGSRSTPGQALGHSGIYKLLKRFFARVANDIEERDLSDRIRHGSTHWLRHTFGRQALSDGVPTEIVQQALGHSSLSTTTIYTSTERSRMVMELSKRQQRGPSIA